MLETTLRDESKLHPGIRNSGWMQKKVSGVALGTHVVEGMTDQVQVAPNVDSVAYPFVPTQSKHRPEFTMLAAAEMAKDADLVSFFESYAKIVVVDTD